METLILAGVIATLLVFILVLLKFIGDLTNKLMSRDYTDYSRAKVLEDEVKKEIEVIKKSGVAEIERY